MIDSSGSGLGYCFKKFWKSLISLILVVREGTDDKFWKRSDYLYEKEAVIRKSESNCNEQRKRLLLCLLSFKGFIFGR